MDPKTPDLYISPVDLFVAYAMMKGTQAALAETKAYYEKRWRLMAALFGISYWSADERIAAWWPEKTMLERLVQLRNQEAIFDFPALVRGDMEEKGKKPLVYLRHREELHRSRASLLRIHETMGGELFEQIFPQILGVRVLWSRLEELGLPALPPDPHQEMIAFIDAIDRPERTRPGSVPINDDLNAEYIEMLKISEEVQARGELSLQRDVELIRQKAIERGLATAEFVDALIFDMPVQQFLDLAKGFPKVSRVHFRPPDLPKPQSPVGWFGKLRGLFLEQKNQDSEVMGSCPGDTEPPRGPLPEFVELNEKMELLRKVNPGLFEQYSEAHIRCSVERIINPGCCEW